MVRKNKMLNVKELGQVFDLCFCSVVTPGAFRDSRAALAMTEGVATVSVRRATQRNTVCHSYCRGAACRIANQDNVFCSKNCESEWRRSNAPKGNDHPQFVEKACLVCEICGSTFMRHKSKMKKRSFCSVKCRVQWQYESGYMAGKNSTTWLGGHADYRGPNWYRQRKLALERDAHRCRRCGAIKGLQVHHNIPYQIFQDYQEANDLNNLETLCMHCHTVADWEYRRSNPEDTRVIPQSQRIHSCVNCGKSYKARGHKSLRCDTCWQRTCQKCGKTFRPRLWHEKNMYCSRECAGTSKPALSVLVSRSQYNMITKPPGACLYRSIEKAPPGFHYSV